MVPSIDRYLNGIARGQSDGGAVLNRRGRAIVGQLDFHFLTVVGEADFSVAVHSRLGQAVDRFGSSGIRESHALDVGGQQVLLSRGRGVGGGNPAGDDHHGNAAEAVGVGVVVHNQLDLGPLLAVVLHLFRGGIGEHEGLQIIEAVDVVFGQVDEHGLPQADDVLLVSDAQVALQIAADVGSQIQRGLVGASAGADLLVVTQFHKAGVDIHNLLDISLEGGSGALGEVVALTQSVELVVLRVLGLGVGSEVASVQPVIRVDGLFLTDAVRGVHGNGVDIDHLAGGVIVSAAGHIPDIQHGSAVGLVAFLLDDHGLDGSLAGHRSLGRVEVVLMDGNLFDGQEAVVRGRIGDYALGGRAQFLVLHGLDFGLDLDGFNLVVIVEGDVDELHSLVNEQGAVVSVVAQVDLDVARLDLVGFSGLFVHAGEDVVYAVILDLPVIQVAAGGALILHQVAGAEAGGVLVEVGAKVQLHRLAGDIPAGDDSHDAAVLHVGAEGTNHHPLGGGTHILSQQGIAVLVEGQGNVFLGDFDLVPVDFGHVLVPQGDAVVGAAHGQGDGVFGLVGGAVVLHAGQGAGHGLGLIGLGDLEVLAVMVGVHRDDYHVVAGLQILQGGIGGVLSLDIAHLHVDGILVEAGEILVSVVGVLLLQGDIVGTDLLDLHELALDHHDVGDEVGLILGDIDLDHGAVVGQIGDVGDLRFLAGADRIFAVGFGALGAPHNLLAGLADVVLGAVHPETGVDVRLVGLQGVAAQAGGPVLHSVGLIGISRLLVEGEVGGDGEGADGDLLVAPDVGGTAEIVLRILVLVVQAQILEVLLAELHGVVIVLGVAYGVQFPVGDVFRIGLVAGHISTGFVPDNGGVSGGDGKAAGVLDHGGLQGVQGQLAGLLAVDRVGALEAQAVEQAGDVAQTGHVHGPAGAGEALELTLVADSAQQHLGKGEAGQGVGGLEGAVAIAADVAGGLAVADDARKGVARGNVGIGAGVVGQSRGGLGANHQRDDDLGGGAAGQLGLRTEGTVLVAGDNADPVQDGNGFLVLDLILVGEVLVLGGSRADGGQRHGHNQCEDQG